VEHSKSTISHINRLKNNLKGKLSSKSADNLYVLKNRVINAIRSVHKVLSGSGRAGRLLLMEQKKATALLHDGQYLLD